MLISFEGGDRCGKTTQIDILKMKIEELNAKVVALKHPNRATPSGKIIDEYLKKKLELSNEAITLCLTSNLWEASERIDEYLKKGYIVLIDRYIHTNLAYSQIRRVELRKLRKLMEGITKPDIVIYLKPEVGTNSSGRMDFGAERYETTEIQEQVTLNYDNIFRNEDGNVKVLKINSSKSIENVSEDIWEEIANLIG